jgi:predicted small lipoprotein YifL
MQNYQSQHSNKIENHQNRTAIVVSMLVSACFLLSACGQRGALYIPNSPEAAQRSTIGDVLTKPASAAPTLTTPTTPATPAPAK